MTEEKRYCDICGKEMEKYMFWYKVEVKVTSITYFLKQPTREKYDVCRKCQWDIIRIIREKRKEEK